MRVDPFYNAARKVDNTESQSLLAERIFAGEGALLATLPVIRMENTHTRGPMAVRDAFLKRIEVTMFPLILKPFLSGGLLERATPAQWARLATKLGMPTRREALSKLKLSLRAVMSADSYRPSKVQLGELCLPVHNRCLAAHLSESYTSDSFRHLFSCAQTLGVFQANVDEDSGLIETSVGDENPSMSKRRWVTDSVRCLPLLTATQRERTLVTISRFYCQPQEREAIERAVANPNWYRHGRLKDGLAHIFLPGTLERDLEWFNNKRLESVGLALDALCTAMWHTLDGRTDKVFFREGFLSDRETRGLLVETIAGLAAYLKAVNTNPVTGEFDFSAPSSGNWEETPFPGGLTWDTEAARNAFVSLKRLMFGKLRSSNLDVRQEIAAAKYGGWLQEKETLDRFIRAGRRKVVVRLTGRSGPKEHPRRPMDSSLSFISTSSFRFTHDVDGSASHHLSLGEVLKAELVRENGMIRFAPFLLDGHDHPIPDGYLAGNYWLASQLRGALTGSTFKEFGSEDCSTTEELALRASQAPAGSEAQWCWTSVLAEGAAKQVCRLLRPVRIGRLSKKRAALANRGLKLAMECITRSYARVTDSNPPCKSNGMECPANSVPEAYEYVTRPDGTMTALPGVNARLAWGTASLWTASRKLAHALHLAEQHRIS